LVNTDVGKSVSVSHHESVGIDESGNTLDPGSLHGVKAGIHQGNRPVVAVFIVVCGDVTGFQIHGKIAISDRVMIKVFLDGFAFIAKGKNKIFESTLGIDIHNMPDNGFFPDLHHGFGLVLRLFSKPGSLSAA